MFTCDLHMPVNTHIHTTVQRAASTGGVLDDVADGASAAAAGRCAARRTCRRSSRPVGAEHDTGGAAPTHTTDPRRPTMGWPPRTVVEPMRLEATAARRVSSVTGRSVCICKEACRDAFALSKSGAGARAAGQERRSRRMLACSKMRSEGRRRASGQPGGGGEGGRT